MFEEFVKAVERWDRIIIHRHNHPDGDALGSQIGLKHLLTAAYPDKKVWITGDEAGRYAFMPGSVMDKVPDSAYESALSVVLDTSSKALISDARYALAPESARIDHHLFLEQICDVEVVDSTYESCCGLVTQLAMEAGWPVTKAAATALFTGMVTDSGRFRFDSTTEDTFQRAAFLMARGVDLENLYAPLYLETLEDRKLRADFIRRVTITPAGVAYVYTTAKECEQLGRKPADLSRGLVNEMADLAGAPIWVSFTESDAGVLCELRSSLYNINPVAVKYGGGGHKKASGATIPDRETAMRMLEDLNRLAGGKA